MIRRRHLYSYSPTQLILAKPTDRQQNIVCYKTERRATAAVTVTTSIQHHSESPRPCDSTQKPEVSVNVDDK